MYVSLFSDSAVFGAPLEVAIQRSVLGTDQLELPTVFRQCIDFLEENGKCEYTTPLPVDRPCWYVPRAKCLPLDPFSPRLRVGERGTGFNICQYFVRGRCPYSQAGVFLCEGTVL